MLTRTQITSILALAVAFWIALLALRGVPISVPMLVPFGTVVAAISACLLIFDRWAWYLPVFRGWLITRPYIHGTWRTELISDWINPETGEAVPPISAFIVIRQTASSLSFRLLTKEARSETVSSGINTCTDGTFEITCTYRNKPRTAFRHRSEVHYGAMLLFANSAAPVGLEGEYWTDRKTRGSVTLTDRRRATYASFEDAQAAFG